MQGSSVCFGTRVRSDIILILQLEASERFWSILVHSR